MRRRLDQVTFRDFLQATQPTAAGAAGFTHMGERSFHKFTPQPLQTLAPGSTHAPSIGSKGCFMSRRLIMPTETFVSLSLRNVSSPTSRVAIRQGFRFVIALVRRHVRDLGRA